MTGQATERLRIDGVPEVWFKSPTPGDETARLVYRPAALIECTLNFRSLRAGLNHSEERNHTAWVPTGELAIDWDSPAVELDRASQLVPHPEDDIRHRQADYRMTRSELEQYEAELIEKLTRVERLRIFFNPVFGLFSAPGDELEHFLPRVAEAALGRVEPELKRLRSRFELHLEQVREAHSGREELSFERVISHKLRLFESENRLAGMFSTLAGSVFGTTEPRAYQGEFRREDAELQEDLNRIEQEASEALRALYDEYLALANEYDIFEIGLQPDNIQVTRRSLLWVPTID
jgi:hypothetical protein